MDNDCPFVPECRECGAYMVATPRRFVLCPNGHGKLFPRCKGFSRRMKRFVRLKSLPIATPTGRRLKKKPIFAIEGRGGVFVRAAKCEPKVSYIEAAVNGRIYKLVEVRNFQ